MVALSQEHAGAAEAGSFYDTPEYAALRFERDQVKYGHLSVHDPLRTAELIRIDRLIADARWAFENPGKTGRYRVSIDGRPIENEPRFETRDEALAHLAPFRDFAGLGVIDTKLGEVIEAKLVERAAHRAELAIGRAA